MIWPPGFFTGIDVCRDKELEIESKKKRDPDGMACSRCKEFYFMAEPNQEDGVTMICWLCRSNPYR